MNLLSDSTSVFGMPYLPAILPLTFICITSGLAMGEVSFTTVYLVMPGCDMLELLPIVWLP